MKARIRQPKTEKTALCAGFSAERLAVLTAVLNEQGIRPRVVRPDELGQTVGALVGLDTPAADTPQTPRRPDTECIVLCGLEQKDLDPLLPALKAAKLIIPFKAMLTAVNRTWVLDDLIGHLAEEHAQVAQRFSGR